MIYVMYGTNQQATAIQNPYKSYPKLSVLRDFIKYQRDNTPVTESKIYISSVSYERRLVSYMFFSVCIY